MRFALTLAVALFVTVGSRPPLAAAADPKRPNVIVFLSDDVGYGEYGFQGNKEIPTPNIDSIAKNGVRFTQGLRRRDVLLAVPRRAASPESYPTRFGHEFNDGGRGHRRRQRRRSRSACRSTRRPSPTVLKERKGTRPARSASGTSAAARSTCRWPAGSTSSTAPSPTPRS